ncbi:TIGR03792 family protein [Synechococcus sp. CS-1332]|uniref:TIGR03792 family protein n=1 Tax=Synechococcus sp. CS-1332 TaxID=2847972 RepID=UPI00223B394F|nr:TIGR03792 family protein [Synechococcus sp. CS-1332]MCT0208557.1 TIGR03792 family protein [Synechococcus sp. CS-1332]
MNRAPLSHLTSCLAGICLVVLVLAGLPGDADALSPPYGGQDGSEGPAAVVELLRVKVPAGARGAWLQAEQESWGPWLRRQDGFLGRDLLWDAEQEEGLLLIRWRSRRQWLAISNEEIEAVQVQFEAAARRALALDKVPNPFPLVDAGELEWVGLTPAAAAKELR